MLFAYSHCWEGVLAQSCELNVMLLWGNMEESVRAGEVKEGFLEMTSLEGGGRVSQAKKKSWIGWFWNSR